MSRSTSRSTNFRRLAGVPELSPTIVRLMMACNDLAIADHSLAIWHGEQPHHRRHRETGARMYFVRLQIAHIFEALSIIEHIRDTPKLRDAVAECDQRTRGSFEKVVSFIGTDDYQIMLRIRNNITFHYGDRVVEKAIVAAAKSYPDVPLTMSIGQETIDWFFAPADRIIDRIVVRDIFSVPDEADVRVEVDNIVVRLQIIVKMFADFAGYFIWRHSNCL